MYITVRVDFEHDGRMDQEDAKEYAALMVSEGVNRQTIDNGVQIHGVEVCGFNE